MMNTLLNWKKKPVVFSLKSSINSQVADTYETYISQYYLKISLLCIFLITSNFIFAQPGIMRNNTDVDGSYANNDMTLTGTGTNNQVFTYKEVANADTAAGTKFYQFNTDNYYNTWNLNNPTYNTVQTATWFAGAGYNGSIKMNATTNGNHYTFNLRRGNNYANQSQAVLETSYNPTNINSYTTPSAIIAGQTASGTVTLSASLNTNEYLYVAWSTDAFASSGNSGVVATTFASGSTYNYTIPSASGSSTVTFYPFTSVASSAPSFANFPLLTLRMRSSTGENNTGAYSSYSVSNLQFNGTTNSLWSVATNWNSGITPSTTANLGPVIIDATCTQDQNATVSALTINSGKTFNGASGPAIVLTIANGGTITNNGTFTATTGLVTFEGTANVSGTITFNNVRLVGGGVNFGSSSTIGSGGYLLINASGFVDVNSPSYHSNATLIYDNGAFGRRVEWSTSSGNGYPSNVQIGNGNLTSLDLSANGGVNAARECSGNLVVSTNSTLTLNNMTQALTIKGKYTNNGTTILSTAIGGDLKLEGDMDDNGTFTANTRAIFFQGAANQTINSTTNPLDIDVMRIGKTGGEVILSQNLLVDETNDPIQFTTAQSVLNLNGKTATFGKANAVSTITMNASSKIKGSSTSSLTILGTDAFGTLYFDQTTPGTTNALSNFNINRTGSGSVTLGTPLTVNTLLTIGSTTTLNNDVLDIKGAITDNRTTKTYTGTIQYSGTDQTIVAATYNNLSLLNAGTKTFGGSTTISGNFVVTTATVPAPSLLTFSGNSAQDIAGLTFNNLSFSGSGAKTFTSNASVSATATVSFTGSGATVDFDGASNNLVFELKSDASGTASIGNASGWTLNGKVTAERYVPAKRAYRIMATPLTGTTNNSISANWQGTPGEGLLLFSPDTYQSQAMVGYTTGGGAPNIRKYDGGWLNITNLTTEPMYGASATDTKPFLVFATGAAGSDNIVTGASATTLRPKGQLITGTVNHTGLATNTFYALANPYASAISPASLIASNSGQKLWLIDPTLGSFGGYATFDGTDWTPATPSGDAANIQSGQGFFIRSASATSFTIAETNKVTGSSTNFFERNESTDLEKDKIRVLLYKQVANDFQLADGILAVNAAEGTNDVDAMDTNKISNFNESIMFRNNTTNLAIEHRALPQVGDMQQMRMTSTTAIPYQLRVFTENYTNSTLQPYVEDTTTGALTAIPTDGSQVIVPFTGVVSSATVPDLRFRIVYQTNLSTDTPSLTNVKVYPNPVVNGQLHINLGADTTNAKYTITNVLGQSVQQGELATTQNTISVPTLTKGMYILNITQEERSYTTKIYVQ